MPNFGYHLARWRGKIVRALYRALLPLIVRQPVSTNRSVPFEVVSYSSEAMLPEQVASVRSFLKHAGRPLKFTVVSDGSHSEESLRLLESLDSSVLVKRSSRAPLHDADRFESYLGGHATGKQLALVMELPERGPTLYIDADVLFFDGAVALADLLVAPAPASYLLDCAFSGDERLLRDAAEKREPVNTGVLFLREKLNWDGSIARFRELRGEPTFFTNQTMTHLTMHENGAKPLDPAKFVLRRDDQFVFADRHASPKIVLRHYVNPVRHKFWTSLS